MATQTKVYDFPFTKIQEQVRSILAQSPGKEASIGDLISKTGLPKHQVEQVLPAVVEDCRGQMKVTESGDILYYFPKGLASQTTGWKAWSRNAVTFIAKAGKFLFKAWIMVMLVGYFALFVALVILALLASLAAKTAANRDNDSRSDSGGGFFGGYMMMRILDLLITFWIWREPRDRGFDRDGRERKRTNSRAFYKSVFAFVFGEEKLEELWKEKEKKAVISFIQNRKGLVSLEEIMAQTGKNREQASAYLSRLMLEYEGEPQVSDQGTLFYSFPELLKTSKTSFENPTLPLRSPIPFNGNASGTNRWIGFFNGFNLAFGAYFTWFGLMGAAPRGFGFFHYFVQMGLLENLLNMSPEMASGVLTTSLGFVPVVFSLSFFLIAFVRRQQDLGKNVGIQKANVRRNLLSKALEAPLDLRLTKEEEKILPEVVGTGDVQVVQAGTGFSYQLKDLDRQTKDLSIIRSQVKPGNYRPGKVIFDSGS